MADRVILIAGLGNPGSQYRGNRHNVGFMALDSLGESSGVHAGQSKFDGSYGRGSIEGVKTVLLKPMTFMNLSGKSVSACSRYFSVSPEDILVIYDDVDLPLGTVRLKTGGGAGGHNGIQSIVDSLGNRDFHRLRLGIGPNRYSDLSDFVLGDFSSTERSEVDVMLKRSVDAVRLFLREGPSKAMNSVNLRGSKDPS